MCFSATASFTAGLALIVCGAAALKCANAKRLKMIAAIPLIFGAQQLIEGMVWVSFLNPSFEPIRMIASYLFLACAGIIWPIWVPLAIARVDTPRHFKRYVPSLIAGILYALLFIACALFYPMGVSTKCNIIYHFDFTNSSLYAWGTYVNIITALIYILATIVPFAITRNKTLRYIAIVVAVSYVVSALFYYEAFISVWCFFAALISILVYGFVYNESKKNKKQN
jgi:hypothetical protein